MNRILICDSRPAVLRFLEIAFVSEFTEVVATVHGGTPAVVCMTHRGPFDLFYINTREMDIKRDYIDIANLFKEKHPKGRVVFMYESFEDNQKCVKEIEERFKSDNYDLLEIPIDFFTDISGHIGMVKSDRVADYVAKTQEERVAELNKNAEEKQDENDPEGSVSGEGNGGEREDTRTEE